MTTTRSVPSPEQAQVLDRLVSWIDRAGLQTPAILALEMGKPLNRVASVALLMVSPSVEILSGGDSLEQVGRFLDQRGSVEYLLRRIEETA